MKNTLRLQIVVLFFFCSVIAFGQVRTTTQDGPWNSTATWGGLSVPDNTFGVITVNHIVTVTADVSINQTTIGAAGSLIVDPLVTLTLVAAAGVELTISGTVTVNGSIVNSGAAAVTCNGSSLVNNGIFSIGTGSLTWSGSGTLSGTGTTTVTDLNVTGTSFTYTGSGSLTMNDDIIGAGTFDASAASGDVIFAGGTSAISGSTPKIFNNLVVTGTMTPAANISYTVYGNIIADGILNDGSGTSTTTFSGTTTISGSGTTKDFFNVTIDAGTVVTYSSNIRFNGVNFIGNGDLITDSPTSPAIITFVSVDISGTGVKDFTNVTIGAGVTTPDVDYTIRGDLVVTGSHTQTSGTVTFDGTTNKTGVGACTFNNVLVNSGATFSGTTSHTINGTFTNNGTVNFTAGTLTLGAASATDLTNTSASTTFDVLTTIAGATITDGPTTNLTITGNFTGGANYSSLGTTTFNQTVTMSGAGTKTFNNLVVTGTMTPAANISYTVNGDITVSGTLNDGSGTSTTTFNASTLISGAGTKDFFSVVINGGAAVTYNSNMSINGNTFVGTGSLVSISPTSAITFTSVAISGAGGKDFANVTIAAGATTPDVDYTIRGNLVVTGSHTQTTGTVTFAGTTAKSGNGACTFNNVVVNSGATFSSTTSHTINGTFTNNGTVDFTAGTLTLGAASVSTLTNPLASTRFNALTTIAGAVITDAATTNLTITGNFVGGANYVSIGTTTFDETVIMSGAGSKTFNNLVVNGVSMTPNAAYQVNGNLSGTGTLAAGNNTATFAGTTLISGSGSKSFFNFTVNNLSSVTYNKDISITGTTLLVNATGSLATDVITSPAIISFTSVAISGTGSKDFTNVTNVGGASTAPNNYTIRGNLFMTGGSLTSTGTPTFAGATTVSGAGALTFTDIIITNPNSLTLSNGTITVNGNIDNFGTINPGAGTLAFGGTSVINNLGIMNFNNVTINSASTLTADNSIISIAGVFTVVGGGTPATFNASGGTIQFATANASNRLAGGGAKTFRNVDVTGTFNNTQDFTVNNNISNSGTINCTAGDVTWGTDGALSGTGTPTTTFFNLIVAAGQTLTISTFPANLDITISSDLTLTGNLFHSATNKIIIGDDQLGTTGTLTSSGTIQFNGAASTFTVGATKNFTNLSVATGAVLSVGNNSAFAIDGTLDVIGTLGAGTGVSVTTFGRLGGGNTPAITGSGSINFDDLVIASLHTLTTSSDISLTGDFTNNGTFTAGTTTINFNGPLVQSILGSNTQFYNLTINKSNTLTVSTSHTVTNTLRLIAGTLAMASSNLSLSSGALVVIDAGTISTSSPGGGPWSVTYIGNSKNSGLEIPSSGNITNLTLTLNALQSVTLTSAVNLTDILSITNDNNDLNSAGFLTLISTATQTANIGSLAGTSRTVSGIVTAQRYFGIADNFDRFISSPVSNGTVAQLQAALPAESFPVTGGFTGTSYPCTGCNNNGHNLRYYREVATGTINNGYQSWITSNTNVLEQGVGYDAYMWNGVSNTTVSLSGTINTGDINLGIATTGTGTSITRTNNSVPSADGWNLVGNPYPSSIQWNNDPAAWTRTNIDPTVWVWDVIGRVWHSSPGDLPGGIIASGQGFWVYVSSVGAGSITIHEQAKSSSTTSSYYRTKNSENREYLKISLSGSGATESTFLMPKSKGLKNPGNLNSFKPEFGFEKMAIAFIPNDVKYGHYVQDSEDEDIPLYIKTEDTDEYTISFTAEGDVADLENYYLVDTYLKSVTQTLSGESYSFSMTPAQQALSSSRFYLTRNPDAIQKDSENAFSIVCYPNPTSGQVSIEINSEDVENVSIMNTTGSTFGRIDLQSGNGITSGKLNMSDLSPGIYIIKGYVQGKVFFERVIKY